MDIAARVAQRHHDRQAKSLGMGNSIDHGSVRIHRYRDHFRVWDLTNAGKRGKKVRVMTIGPTYSYKGNHDEWMERQAKNILSYRDFGRIKGFFGDILKDYPGEINIEEFQERGIDVNPGGTKHHKFKTVSGLEVTAEPMDFRVLNRWEIIHPKTQKPTGNFQDTFYYPVKKADAKRFYNWLSANLDKAKRMDLEDFRKLWREIGVRYDYH